MRSNSEQAVLQNYAVSAVQRMHDNPERHEKIQLLAAKRSAAWNHWWQLFQDPDVWSDKDKRHAMLRARRDYNDLTLEWYFARKKAPEK